jgi:ZIP family zinc transporter
MALSLGFAAGVMILVSFVELLPKGMGVLGFGWGYVAFLGGLVVMFLLDAAIPHSYQGVADAGAGERGSRLLRLGLFVALGIGIHNFPEGMATFVSTLADPGLGAAIAVAIALHNIPEGLAVAAPVYAATGSRGKAFVWSFLSGVAEPVGAGLAAAFLLPFLRHTLLAAVLAGVAGLMVFISLDELLPAAREHGEEHLAIIGAVFGMTVMAVSLWLLAG